MKNQYEYLKYLLLKINSSWFLRVFHSSGVSIWNRRSKEQRRIREKFVQIIQRKNNRTKYTKTFAKKWHRNVRNSSPCEYVNKCVSRAVIIFFELLSNSSTFANSFQRSSFVRYCKQNAAQPTAYNEWPKCSSSAVKQLRCQLCNLAFPSNWVSNLKRHLKLHSSYERMKCNVCHQTYSNFPNFSRHLGRSHQGYESSVTWTPTTDGARQRPTYR